MLAGVTMTGQGEALGMAVYDGRWYIAPSNVRIRAEVGPRSECRSTASSSNRTRQPHPCFTTTAST